MAARWFWRYDVCLYYRFRKDEQTIVRKRIKEIAATRVRYGISGFTLCCSAGAGTYITNWFIGSIVK